MKKNRVIIPALALIALGTAASITGTVAWFSMNTKVSITGMQVSTKVSSNMQIVGSTLAATAKADDATFVTSLSDAVGPAVLEPVSTINGKSFFYTTNAKASGDANSDVYTAYNAAEVPTSDELTAFNSAYGSTGAVGYLDYVFQLKVVNSVAASRDIKVIKLDLVYGGAKDASKAYRVAVFSEKYNSNFSSGSGTLKGIYAPSGAANFSDSTYNYAIGAASGVPQQLALDSHVYNGSFSVASVAASATEYYKVVLRLYLEGEDTTCKNETFASLTDSWRLNVELGMDINAVDDDTPTFTPVAAIAKYTTATVSATTYYYDGSTYLWTDIANLGTATGRTAIADASADVKAAFGYVAP